MIFGQHDENTLAQYEDCLSRAERGALMADGHLGYIMPIGGVMAYKNQVSVPGVGFDIACGNMAVKTDIKMSEGSVVRREALYDLADEIRDTISFGMGGKNKAPDAPRGHELFDNAAWQIVPLKHRTELRAKARSQLGTVGGGNHYVDIFSDEEGYLWIGVHFGSRGFGHAIASNFLALGNGAAWGERVKEQETLLSLDTELGKDYWSMMQLAGIYAHVGRNWVVHKVEELMCVGREDVVHNNHNFAWKEEHQGQDLIVIRKGATPAFPGQRGFVGGSMGDEAVILKGAEVKSMRLPPGDAMNATHRQMYALFSTVHGAGRVMSRSQAIGNKNREARVTSDMMQDWVREKGVILRGGGVDESPHVYKRLPDVLAAQGNTIEILHTLTPLIVVMASGKGGRR